MAYIKQKSEGGIIVVDTTDFIGELSTHPSIVEHPELFEIVEGEKPEKYTGLDYVSDKNIEKINDGNDQ
jgi:hypothetical protein